MICQNGDEVTKTGKLLYRVVSSKHDGNLGYYHYKYKIFISFTDNNIRQEMILSVKSLFQIIFFHLQSSNLKPYLKDPSLISLVLTTYWSYLVFGTKQRNVITNE